MARFTQVYVEFTSRLNEVNLLTTKANRLEKSKNSMQNGPEISALCRGSVVLLSSHIEAYIKELGEHTLDAIYNKEVCRSKLAPQFFYYISKARIDTIRETSQPERLAEHVLAFMEHESSFWASKERLPIPISSQAFNGGFSNPKFEKVKSYLRRFGYKDFRSDFFQKLGREAQTNITNLDQIVDTRNSIAHGDLSATKTPGEVREMVATARIFCRTVDSLFGTWCRSNLCSIR